MKQIIRLTESDLHRIIKESARRIIKEYIGDDGEYGRDAEANSDHYSDDLYSSLNDDELANVHDWSTVGDNDTPELDAMKADSFERNEENNLRDQFESNMADDAMAFYNPEDAEPEY